MNEIEEIKTRIHEMRGRQVMIDKDEWEILKSQFVISNWGDARTLPYAFTEQESHAILCA